MATPACTVCASERTEVFVRLPRVPIHCNLLWPSREGALGAPRGDMELAFCRNCGHVFNAAFDPSLMEYTQAYENSLHFSPRFQSYAEALADRLIGSYSIRNKDVIDIGCGKGDFLILLCERGENRGWGFDPSFVPDQVDASAASRMTIIQDFYSPRYSSYKADLITCRHVLEHIRIPGEFLGNVREAVGDRSDTIVFFEVPNALYTLRDLGIWDLIYEHCSYFTAASLKSTFLRAGFAVKQVAGLYEGQFLGIDTTAASPVTKVFGDEVAEVDTLVRRFAGAYSAKVQEWKTRFQQFRMSGTRVVMWGGGSKGVTFLNTLQPGEIVRAMVDINPRKQGMFVAGTGHQVVSPESLRQDPPEVVIVLNPIYRDEIAGQLAGLGLHPTLEFA